MSTIFTIKLYNFRKRKTHIAHHRVHVENLLKGLISINSSRLTSMLYILSSKNPTNSNVLKSCYSICFVLVDVMKYLFAILTCYINNFQLDNEKGIKVKCMMRVKDTKDCFNLIENGEICYEEQEFCAIQNHHIPLIVK